MVLVPIPPTCSRGRTVLFACKLEIFVRAWVKKAEKGPPEGISRWLVMMEKESLGVHCTLHAGTIWKGSAQLERVQGSKRWCKVHLRMGLRTGVLSWRAFSRRTCPSRGAHVRRGRASFRMVICRRIEPVKIVRCCSRRAHIASDTLPAMAWGVVRAVDSENDRAVVQSYHRSSVKSGGGLS